MPECVPSVQFSQFVITVRRWYLLINVVLSWGDFFKQIVFFHILSHGHNEGSNFPNANPARILARSPIPLACMTRLELLARWSIKNLKHSIGIRWQSDATFSIEHAAIPIKIHSLDAYILVLAIWRYPDSYSNKCFATGTGQSTLKWQSTLTHCYNDCWKKVATLSGRVGFHAVIGADIKEQFAEITFFLLKSIRKNKSMHNQGFQLTQLTPNPSELYMEDDAPQYSCELVWPTLGGRSVWW